MGKVTLNSVKALKRTLTDQDLINLLIDGGKKGTKYIKEQWEQGNGANGKQTKPLSEDYKKAKMKAGGSGIRDFKLKGTMKRSLNVYEKENKKSSVFITVSDRQSPKAMGNANLEPNILKKGKELMNVIRNEMVRKLKQAIRNK